MCGLAGFIGFDNNEALARQANVIQAHRGPDHQAIWSDDFVSLAHQRLSIIDLTERGNQPFQKANLLIVFNGEIYNYKELRKNLEQIGGIEFKSDSDTEVVLEYFRLFNEKCLDHFIGMFAFAIYDVTTQSLFLARDHFGIKPLFYYHDDFRFAFSSELKTLTSIEEISLSINYKSLVSSLNYLWVSGNETMFHKCYKLAPGHYLRLTASKELTISKYWSLSDSIGNTNEAEVINELTKVINGTIERHMVADVPVSAFLSGGLDSSLVSVLASNINQNLSTYTIAISQKDKKIEQMPDDQRYAKQLASMHHFDHNEILISSQILDLLPKIVRTLDEPIGDPAAINTFIICEAARKKGVKVLLSGMGADEIFGGYRRHRAALLSLKFKMLPSIVQKMISSFANLLPVRMGSRGIRITRWAKRFLEFASMPFERSYMRSYSYYSSEELGQLLKGDHSKDIEMLGKEHSEIFNSKFKGDLVNQMCNTDLHLFLLGLNLTYSDRASMAASVEVRVPFVDKKVIEYAMTISGDLKIKGGESKYILKKVSENYLPEEIIYRPKAPFGAPIRAWISNELRSLVDELLSAESIRKRGIFNYDFVKKIIDDDRKGVVDNAYRIYQFLTIELWFREFVDKSKTQY
ncbi:MAG: asparagine synthase (glutamine-hydrolyzing) [Cyclobacteriaceae bacterium]